jgi:hypothetical protein
MRERKKERERYIDIYEKGENRDGVGREQEAER